MSVPQPSEKLFDEAVDQMKSSTRRYAKRQVSWLRNKLLPAVYGANTEADTKPPTPTYLLDATGKLIFNACFQSCNESRQSLVTSGTTMFWIWESVSPKVCMC